MTNNSPAHQPEVQPPPGAIWGYRVLRYFVAFFVLLYGFAKLNGSQFTILDSELDKPMGHVSGFWLTWYYFGYSAIYGNLIGLVQVAGGILLMFRKTTLLASFLLLPVITNIILINVFYQIDILAPVVALLLELALLGILSFHKQELIELFWSKQDSAFPHQPAAKSRMFVKYAVCALMIVITAAFTYWTANYNNRLPTPIDGAWEVTSASPQNIVPADLTEVFFERNRAGMCVFKRKDGSYAQHHFEVDTNKKTLTMWEEWLRKGDQIFTGSYELSGDELRISGKFGKSTEPTLLVLKRRKVVALLQPRESATVSPDSVSRRN